MSIVCVLELIMCVMWNKRKDYTKHICHIYVCLYVYMRTCATTCMGELVGKLLKIYEFHALQYSY